MKNFMIKANVPMTCLPSGHVAFDLDVFPMGKEEQQMLRYLMILLRLAVLLHRSRTDKKFFQQ